MLDKLLKYVYRLVRYRAYWVIGLFLVLIVLSLTYLFPFPIRSSLLDLLPQNDPLINEYRERQGTINNTQNLTVVLSHVDGEELTGEEREDQLLALAEVVAPRIEEIPEIESVSYRGEELTPEKYELLYSLNDKTLEEIRDLESELRGFSTDFPFTGRLESGDLYGDLISDYERVSSADSLSEDRMVELLSRLEERNQFALAGLEGSGQLGQWDGKLKELREDLRTVRRERERELGREYLSDDCSTLLVQAKPRHAESHNIKFSDRLTHAAEMAISDIKQGEVYRSGSYDIRLTGSFVTNSQRNKALRDDMLKTTVVSSLAVMVAFFFALGSLFYSVLVAFPLVVAVLLTLSWAKFSVGGFNLLTTFLPALVLGLSVDYGIHLLFRFSEERLDGLTVSRAIRVTILKKGKGTFIAALTTSAVFTTLIFSRSQGLVEMGVITSLGIIISFLVYIFLLPSLIVTYQRWRRRRRTVELFDYRSALTGIVDKAIKYRKTLLLISVVISGLALFGALQLNFQFSNNNVSTEVESIKVQKEVQRQFGSSEVNIGPSFAFFPDNLEKMKQLEKKLSEMKQVKTVNSIGNYLPDDFGTAIGSIVETKRIDEIQSVLSGLQTLLEDREVTVGQLESLVGDLSSAQLSSTLSSRSEITVQLNRVIDQLLDIRKKLRSLDRDSLLKTVGSLQNQLSRLEAQLKPVNELPSGDSGIVKALPDEVRSTLTTGKGEFVVIAGVEKSIYESENLNEFVEEVSSFSDDYFGLPLIQYQLEGHIRHDFIISTSLAVLMISFIIFLGIRNLKLSLLAVIPLLFGYLWMLGGMKVLGMNFNFINIIISPLLIGIGVDDGLHLIYRWREEELGGGLANSIKSAFSHTGLAVVTTSLTTIVVFGSLFIARTPGLRILGGTSLLGIGFAMVLSLSVLPAALYLAFKRSEE